MVITDATLEILLWKWLHQICFQGKCIITNDNIWTFSCPTWKRFRWGKVQITYTGLKHLTKATFIPNSTIRHTTIHSHVAPCDLIICTCNKYSLSLPIKLLSRLHKNAALKTRIMVIQNKHLITITALITHRRLIREGVNIDNNNNNK